MSSLRLHRAAWLLVLLGAAGCAAWQRPGQPLGVQPRAGARHVELASGQTLYLEDRGEGGVPALLIHGFASNREVWDPLVPVLQRTRRVLAVDLPGFGGSSRLAGDYSPDALAAGLLEALDRLGVRQVDLVAHSWGSSISLALALRAPERVRRLVLVGAFVFDEQVPPFFRWAWAPGVGEALFSMFYEERPEDRFPLAFAEPERISLAVVERIRASFKRPGTVRAALAAARGMRFLQLERRYSKIPHETLLLWGREDHVARLRFGERLARTLPRSRLQVLRGVGHFPPLERPAEVARAIEAFLSPEAAR